MANTNRLKVINLFGTPGQGKSATRSGLFWLMKVYGYSVEEVSEYAKYLVLARRQGELLDQDYIFAKQKHKQRILQGQYEYAVTDSPLLLNDFYAPVSKPPEFSAMVMKAYNDFDNINFFLTRNLDETEFENNGRLHTKEQSRALEAPMRKFLADRGVQYLDLPIDMLTPWRILECLAPGTVEWPQFQAVARERTRT